MCLGSTNSVEFVFAENIGWPDSAQMKDGSVRGSRSKSRIHAGREGNQDVAGFLEYAFQFLELCVRRLSLNKSVLK